MSNIAEQESLVKASLFQFIIKQVPNADLKVIDDIVLAYVISILEEASQDPCFDVEGFIEMMSAYIPEFSKIDPGVVCDWVLELEAELRRDESDASSNNDDSAASDRISLTLQSLSEMLPTATKPSRSHSNSESSEASEGRENRRVIAEEPYADRCQALLDMFPNTPPMEIKHCVHIASGDVSLACATLLLRRETGAALTLPPPKPVPAIDDSELKNRIIERYSYVDKDSETKEHRPLAPKIEPKKLVRYRDNKIVSLKGERYTEVSKSGVDEEHLKKPKKQHCP